MSGVRPRVNGFLVFWPSEPLLVAQGQSLVAQGGTLTPGLTDAGLTIRAGRRLNELLGGTIRIQDRSELYQHFFHDCYSVLFDYKDVLHC